MFKESVNELASWRTSVLNRSSLLHLVVEVQQLVAAVLVVAALVAVVSLDCVVNGMIRLARMTTVTE